MRDKTIKQLGEVFKNKILKAQNPVDIFIENPYPGKDYYILLLKFDCQEKDAEILCNYSGIDVEELTANNSNYVKYAYRKGSPRGGDITLTTKLVKGNKKTPTEENVEKKLRIIDENVFKKIKSRKDKDAYIFKVLYQTFKENKEIIQRELTEVLENADKNVLMSFKIILNDKEKYLYEFETIRNIIMDTVKQSYYIFNNKESKGQFKTDSVTQKQADEVFGFAAPLSFATVDKPGFVPGFFNIQENWKNYPVSMESAVDMELGYRFLFRELQGKFYGNQYLIIPNPVLPVSNEEMFGLVKRLHEAMVEENLRRSRKERAEDYVMKKIGEWENYITVDLMFFFKSNAAFRINLFLEEILPSTFSKIFSDIPDQINKYSLFQKAKYVKKTNYYEPLKFHFGLIKQFFPEDFLEITQKIFEKGRIDKDYVFSHLMAYYRKKKMKNPEKSQAWLIREAIMVYLYLKKRGIINENSKNNHTMKEELFPLHKNQEEQAREDKSFNLEAFENFVRENTEFLNSDIKIGLFALGVLVRYVLDYQQRNLKATPFINKLHGFKLSPELVQKIEVEALNKLTQYSKSIYTYNELKEMITKKLNLHFPELEKLSNYEISFYFVTGMELGYLFKNKDNN